MTNNSTVKRSSIPDIRRTMLEKGALLFRFTEPSVPHKEEHTKWFRQMEELGFLVTTSGCIFPYENFTGSSKSRPKGHKISANFFIGEPPTFEANIHGWPTETQASHRCHRKHCINPNHIVFEPQWKNLKRNYCGEHGQCDCNVAPPCLTTYHNDKWSHGDEYITYETKEYKRQVSHLIPGQRFTILPKNHYDSVDNRKEKRNERLRSKRKTPPIPQSNNNKRSK